MPCKTRASYLWKKFGVRKWHQLKSDENGAAAVEFAIVAFPFFLLLMTIIEVSLFFFAGQVLENAVDKVGRQLRTGQLNASSSLTELKNKIYAETDILFTRSELIINLQTADSFRNLPPLPSRGSVSMNASVFGSNSPGPKKIMRLIVSYKWPVFTNYAAASLTPIGGKALITAISIFRSEPY